MASEGSSSLRILLFPLMAQGHMLPMLDISKLLAARGVRVTILTTPANAAAVRPTLDRANASLPIPISLRIIPFPAEATGLHEGSENASFPPSDDLLPAFLWAIRSLRRDFEEVLRELLPDCVVSDIFMPWTQAAATELEIPRLIFQGSNFFFQCMADAAYRHKLTEKEPHSPAAAVLVPGLPHRIEMLGSQLMDPTKMPPELAQIMHEIKMAEPKSYGMVVNSFYEMEPEYVEHFQRVVFPIRSWAIGPVALCNEDDGEKTERRLTPTFSAVDRGLCLNWLDGKPPRSVVYVCFGTMSRFTGTQLSELALGLESSGHPFIWVVGGGGESESLLPEGYEERTEGRGLIIRGFAPQIRILNHPSVGGFVTHCGWNSIMEGISAGLPMATWPLFADQFFNERLLLDVLKVGLAVGAKEYTMRAEERPVVAAAEVRAAVRGLMGRGGEAEERRRRAGEMAEKARRAVEKGGSSYEDLGRLIEELMRHREEKEMEKGRIEMVGAEKENSLCANESHAVALSEGKVC
ncbi:UDP-glycosyltransferase 73B5 [Apostasia shenzhenica]|uniref:Glycosyltransferase n=1 Tax=Apostasia shenzhenica TaxID=1088818 RepID=A0A2I0AYG8_9ASPA|nr:UDP-glycosyltransferase 73B5 [Apostasia shenzhenica]